MNSSLDECILDESSPNDGGDNGLFIYSPLDVRVGAAFSTIALIWKSYKSYALDDCDDHSLTNRWPLLATLWTYNNDQVISSEYCTMRGGHSESVAVNDLHKIMVSSLAFRCVYALGNPAQSSSNRAQTSIQDDRTRIRPERNSHLMTICWMNDEFWTAAISPTYE